ncbi:MAG: YggS family pyridoxal phosphate-dependent enzyme, partial [Undibacterium sp.]|nr:YggS family pyridoxal phosphate-dependent enzyme [Undibacterium sp.]
MSSIAENLQAVHKTIAHAAQHYGRNPTEIDLLAVSKTFDAAHVIEAWNAGQRAFGENYLQEALGKMQQTATMLARQGELARPIWHFIGPIQSNKTKAIAENFSWVHSVDREKIAERLSAQRPAELGALQI